MEDSRIAVLAKKLTSLVERMSWFMRDLDPEGAVPADLARDILVEWASLAPQMELLEAIVGEEELNEIQGMIAIVQVRVRVGFLLMVDHYLEPQLRKLTSELMMRLPVVMTKPIDAGQSTVKAAFQEKLGVVMKDVLGPDLDLERIFREGMAEADESERQAAAAHAQLMKDWPDEWAVEAGKRPEGPGMKGLMEWREDVREELLQLIKEQPWLRRQ